MPLPAAHRNNFDLLRLFFASLVLVSHAPELRDGNRSRELLTRAFGSISFGELAVAGFFILSGYLITLSWEKRPDPLDFLQKRVRRIVPGFWVAFGVSVLLVGPLAAGLTFPAYFHTLYLKGLALEALLLRPPTVPNPFPGTPYPILNGALYTIAYEFRCYLLAAGIGLAGAWRPGTARWLWLSLFVLSLGLLLVPTQVERLDFPLRWYIIDSPLTFQHFLTYFSAGACFQYFKSHIPLSKWGALGAFMLFCRLAVFPAFALIGLGSFGAYALVWLAFANIPFLRIFQNKTDISYGIYLYGWPVQCLLNFYWPAKSPWVLLLVAFLVCCALGWGSYMAVERHF